jgi:hypothetical protein
MSLGGSEAEYEDGQGGGEQNFSHESVSSGWFLLLDKLMI